MNLCYVSDYCLAMMRSGAWGLCTILAGYDGGHSEQHKNFQINATSCFRYLGNDDGQKKST